MRSHRPQDIDALCAVRFARSLRSCCTTIWKVCTIVLVGVLVALRTLGWLFIGWKYEVGIGLVVVQRYGQQVVESRVASHGWRTMSIGFGMSIEEVGHVCSTLATGSIVGTALGVGIVMIGFEMNSHMTIRAGSSSAVRTSNRMIVDARVRRPPIIYSKRGMTKYDFIVTSSLSTGALVSMSRIMCCTRTASTARL
jgi:hypothetical protein